MQRAHIFVSGRVQGVFYRAFVEQEACELGLSGFVRNLPDGRVELVVEGKREQIEKLISRLHVGPPAARVEDVEVSWRPAKGEFDSFERRW
jgi:acylphosphatase